MRQCEGHRVLRLDRNKVIQMSVGHVVSFSPSQAGVLLSVALKSKTSEIDPVLVTYVGQDNLAHFKA